MQIMLELNEREVTVLRRLLAFVNECGSACAPLDQAKLAALFSESEMRDLLGILAAFEEFSGK